MGSEKNQLASLPPTEDAAKMHSLRVYHQVQSWLGNTPPADKWGWHRNPKLSPIRSTLGPAPSKVLNSIFCCCAKSCGCRKIGLQCSEVCINCNGNSCENSRILDLEDEEHDVDGDLLETEDLPEINEEGQLDPTSELSQMTSTSDSQPRQTVVGSSSTDEPAPKRKRKSSRLTINIL